MRFGERLRSSVYEPWRPHYIDYAKLKELLREDDAAGDGAVSNTGGKLRDWTEEDESAFVEELVNVQLEKVHTFQVETYKQLQKQTSQCESKLEQNIVNGGDRPEGNDNPGSYQQEKDDTLTEVLKELDSITREISALEKYTRLNFTGFMKAAKKHDRRRGSRYRVRPLLQVRLAALPFNTEDYSPLLYRLSAMYSFVRQRMQGDQARAPSTSDARVGKDKYKSYKFWVHPENLWEVKTYILRRLPILVYNPQTSKVVDSGQPDPTITSLYFDNPQFSLYTKKVDNISDASSLRLRWFGHLEDKPEILLEKKTIGENGGSEEVRFPIKDKYVQPFITGEYKLEKTIEKLRDRQGSNPDDVSQLERNVENIQAFIKENQLQPMLRANYTRTAFQIPGDDRVRISLDTDLAFLREDSLDAERPCRNHGQWHRADTDHVHMEFPFSGIRQGEISLFPCAVLEIKVRSGSSKRTQEWIDDLMSSHLVKEAPRFSKFVHGVAQLFEDSVNSFPFWFKDLETDIRKDPGIAFQEEQEKKAKQAEDELAVGSLLGSKPARSFRAAVGSPVNQPATAISNMAQKSGIDNVVEEADSDDDTEQASQSAPQTRSRLRSLLPSFSSSKYARAHRLPPHIREPGQFIKDSGPVRVEPKVWLANQRTFIKWQHISVLLASLSLGLYNAAGASNNVARGLAIIYTLVAAFAGAWGWWIYIVRSRMIEQRSGKDFDAVFGPTLVCIALMVALMVNFGLKYRGVSETSAQGNGSSTLFKISGQGFDAPELPGWADMWQDLRS